VPILTSDWSRPEPDLAVIRGVVEDDVERAVTADDTALVVEIAGTNLLSDRTDMARVYAAAGIPVYWIVNLAEGQIEISADPGHDGYQSHQVLGRGQDVPVVVAGIEVAWIAVSDLLA
jgi:Uma2 family endonuclease